MNRDIRVSQRGWGCPQGGISEDTEDILCCCHSGVKHYWYLLGRKSEILDASKTWNNVT